VEEVEAPTWEVVAQLRAVRVVPREVTAV